MSESTMQSGAGARKARVRRDASGTVFTNAQGRVYVRLSLSGKRPCFALPWATSEDAARSHATLMADVARKVRETGDAAHVDVATKILERIAETQDAKRLSELVATVERMLAGAVRFTAAPVVCLTFGDVAKMWTSGDLAARFPHHLKKKRSVDDDKQRLEKFVTPIVGTVRVASFSLDDAERVMGALPAKLAPATRRQVAQVVSRVLKLAVFPLRIVASNPIPQGWLPRVPKSSQKKQATLYPSEADTFVASSAPLELRLFVGFVAREGMRHDEAEKLTWADVDTERGIVRLDENKTDDARSWPLRPDVSRALAAWKKLSRKTEPTDSVFVDADGEPLTARTDIYREQLSAAGIKRPELFDGSTTKSKTGFHGLRALFVTEALARGMSEAWVTDRTGHKSSNMVREYQRPARTFAEAQLAPLGDLAQLLGFPASVASICREPDDESSDSRAVSSQTAMILAGTEGGSRTHKPCRIADFESAAFAIPPLRLVETNAEDVLQPTAGKNIFQRPRARGCVCQKVPTSPAPNGETNGLTRT